MGARIVLLCLLSLCAAACAWMPGPDLHGLKLESVKAVEAGHIAGISSLAKSSRSDRLFFVAHITAERDLAAYAKQYEYNVASDASACREGQSSDPKKLQNDNYIYDALGQVTAFRQDGEQAGQSGYDIYVAANSIPLASGPVFGYDMLNNPQDICVQLLGGNMFGDRFISNTVVIPKSVLVEALAQRLSSTNR